MYTIIVNSCNWHCPFKVELATMSLGLLSHHSGCISKSIVASFLIMMSRSELEVPRDELCTVPCMRAALTMMLLRL